MWQNTVGHKSVRGTAGDQTPAASLTLMAARPHVTNDALSLVGYEVICLVPSQWWLTVNPNGQNVTLTLVLLV